MRIKNELVSWYIRKIIGPNIVHYDNPGFVITKYDTPRGCTFQRDVFLPESLIVDIENKVTNILGNEGKEILYSIGKQFGFNFSKLFNVPQITKENKNEVQKFIEYAIMFICATWSRGFDYNLNLNEKILHVNFDQYVVCRKNGIGEIFSSGGPAGVWSWVFNDYTIEGSEIKCQGRGDNLCEVVCAPKKYLDKKKYKHYEIKDLINIDYSKRYIEFNNIQKTVYSTLSAKELITQGIFRYKDGMIIYKNERYFPIGIEFFYLLEYILGKVGGGSNILFNSSYDFGKKLALESGNYYLKFIIDYMSALGWGDVTILKDDEISIGVNFFPWTVLADKIDFIIFRGLVSGMLSVILKKEIVFNKTKKRITNSLSVIVSR